MNARIRPSLIPQCSSCARSYLEAGSSRWTPVHQQIRGAKSLSSQPDTIPVQLLKHLTGFGKQGSYVPISAGQMRNRWFPTKVARYAVGDELRDIKAGKIHVERDSEFSTGRYVHQLKRKQAEDRKAAIAAAKKVAMQEKKKAIAVQKTIAKTEFKILDPQRSLDLLEVLLPSTLEFHRPSITTPEPPPEKKAIPTEVTAILNAGAASATPGPIAIYGSVSTTDVSNYVKEYVAYNDEASRVTLSEDDIRFVGVSELEESTRVKHLGEYVVEISIRGSEGRVRRKVAVLKQRMELEREEEAEVQ